MDKYFPEVEAWNFRLKGIKVPGRISNKTSLLEPKKLNLRGKE